jgi:hypothetical protein
MIIQTKSPSAIPTARTDILLIRERLKTARNDFELRCSNED